MRFDPPLIAGWLLRRYHRFFVDVELADGRVVTAHCPNTGRMSTCCTPGWEVRLSPADNPRRKLRYTLEMIHNGRCWIGVNTLRANPLVAEAITGGRIPELTGATRLAREVRWQGSRLDLMLETPAGTCFVEVKNVTLVDEHTGDYLFPDAVTARGLKHLHALADIRSSGRRAVLFFAIQRSDGRHFRSAAEIDPEYAAGLCQVQAAGVEVLTYRFAVDPAGAGVAERVALAGSGTS
jgi:sugar fermentation stimulation protein A